MKRTSKFARLRLKSAEKIPIRSPIAKFFTNPPSQVKLQVASDDQQPALVSRVLQFDEPGPSSSSSSLSKNKSDKPKETASDDDFQEESFKRPPPPLPPPSPNLVQLTKLRKVRSGGGVKTKKKQSDIRKVLGINPELDYAAEEQLQRMLRQKGREDNCNADELQMALALSRSMTRQQDNENAAAVTTTTTTRRAKANERAKQFFELLGMNPKTKRKMITKRTKKAPKVTLLSERDAEKEDAKIESRIERIVQVNCPSVSQHPLQEFPITSGYLYDLRVNEQRVMQMNIEGGGCDEKKQNLEKFYVKSNLFAKTAIPAGHLLRDWSKIPGRSPSPEVKKRRESAVREDALEREIEEELEEINKQSEVFLRNFNWREAASSGSPDMFGDFSASASSIVIEEEEEEKEEEDGGEKVGEKSESEEEEVLIFERINCTRPPLSQRHSIVAPIGTQRVDILSYNPELEPCSPEMEAEIDLTQESDAEEGEQQHEQLVDISYEVQVLNFSPKESPKTKDRSYSSIDQALARARSLLDDLNGQSDNEALDHQSRTITTNQRSPERVKLSDEKTPVTVKTKAPSPPPPSICIVDSDEEVINEPSSTALDKISLGASVLNGLSRIDWSKDQFSMEMQANQVEEPKESQGALEEPSPEKDLNLEPELSPQLYFDSPHEYPPTPPSYTPFQPPPWEDEVVQNQDTQSSCQSLGDSNFNYNNNNNIIDLCDDDDDDDEEADDLVAMELEQIQFSQPPTAIDKESKVKSGATKLPPSKDMPLHQLIIRTDNVTPPPNYNALDSPALEVELEKYGLKTSLPRRNATRLLQHLYTQLHPLVADDVDLADLQAANPLNETVRHLEQQLGVENVPVLNGGGVEKEREKEDNPPPKSTTRSKTKATCELPLAVAFKNRLLFDREYHTRILHYSPIELKELMLFFKSIGCRYDAKDVIALLDQHCITYRTVEAINSNNKKYKNTNNKVSQSQ